MTKVINNYSLVTLFQMQDGMEQSDMTMSNDRRQLSGSNYRKSSEFAYSLSKSTMTISIQDKKIKLLTSTSTVQNKQSKEQQDNVNFNLPMALVNEMETDSVVVIPQMDNKKHRK